jgi:hypothetical protein
MQAALLNARMPPPSMQQHLGCQGRWLLPASHCTSLQLKQGQTAAVLAVPAAASRCSLTGKVNQPDLSCRRVMRWGERRVWRNERPEEAQFPVQLGLVTYQAANGSMRTAVGPSTWADLAALLAARREARLLEGRAFYWPDGHKVGGGEVVKGEFCRVGWVVGRQCRGAGTPCGRCLLLCKAGMLPSTAMSAPGLQGVSLPRLRPRSSSAILPAICIVLPHCGP